MRKKRYSDELSEDILTSAQQLVREISEEYVKTQEELIAVQTEQLSPDQKLQRKQLIEKYEKPLENFSLNQ